MLYNKNDHIPSDVMSIYRAVGEHELKSIFNTKQFSFWPRSAEVKYFGLNFEETLQFANKAYYDYVAVIEVKLSKTVLKKIGDFTCVDAFLFKHGTVEIQPEVLNEFNNSIIEIRHRDWR